MNSIFSQDIYAEDQNVDYLHQVGDEVDLSVFDCARPLSVRCDGEWRAVSRARRDGYAFILDVGYLDEVKVDATGDNIEDVLVGHCITEAKGFKLDTFASLQQEYAAASAERRCVKALLKEASSRKIQAFEKMVNCASKKVVPNMRISGVRVVAVDDGRAWVKCIVRPLSPTGYLTMTVRDFAIKYIIGNGE